jgi:YVTN family beta-propeller protein
VKVTVLSDASATSLVRSLLPAFAAAAGIHAEDARRLRTIVEGLLNFTLDNAYLDDDLGEIEVTLEADEGFVHVTVHDWGLPLTSAGGDFGPLPEQLAALTPADANMQLLNLGSDGKRLVALVSVSSSGDPEARRHHIEAAARRTRMRAETPDAIEVRAATQEDAKAIAQLLYENYHLSYVHADFYRPRYLMAALASGGLVSTIALHDGRVIGHRSGRTARLCKRFRSATDLRASPGARGPSGLRTRSTGPFSRLDFRRGAVTKQIPVAAHPAGIAVGASAVWVASEESGTVLLLDPRSGKVVDAVEVGNGPVGIAVGEGDVWVANRQGGATRVGTPAPPMR